jgi:hypothetical protein
MLKIQNILKAYFVGLSAPELKKLLSAVELSRILVV